MIHTSEWVSPAHPDRLADCIAAKITDQITKKDGFNSHAAIEVFITNNKIIIGGEATTTIPLTPSYLESIIRETIVDIGYNNSLRKKGFTTKEVYTVNDYQIESYVIPQSPDIANGVSINKGFNDNGIFFGYAENSNPTKLGLAHAIATELGEYLYSEALKENSIFGPDIKTLITTNNNNKITNITVSIPSTPKCTKPETQDKTRELIHNFINNTEWIQTDNPIHIIINGTGKYSIHGSHGDSGLTGRKIVVNGSGGYAPNGGGSQIKGFTASDALLNFAARWIAKSIINSNLAQTCTVALACAIGQKSLQSITIELDHKEPTQELYNHIINTINNTITEWSPAYFNSIWTCYKESRFYNIVKSNFYGKQQDWETNLIQF